jgi:cytoskeletal protein CcmA (bactofilin family)
VEQASMDRKQMQALSAAQAGVETYLASLSGATGTEACAPISGTTPGGGSFEVTVTLLDGSGSQLACAGEPVPAAAQLVVTGTAGPAGRAVTRRLQVYVALEPVYAGIDKAIFSDQLLTLSNRLTVNAGVSPGDLYTNGDFTSSNNTSVAGSVYAQGSGTVSNSGSIAGDFWANGAVVLRNNATVGGDVTSSTSTVTLQNSAHVAGNVTAGGAVSAAPGAVDGTVTQYAPQGPPPPEALPRFTWDAQAWQDAGYTVQTFSDCAAAKAFIQGIAAGDYAVRITGTCGLSWGNNSTINVRGNLAIVADGNVSTTNRVTFRAVGATHRLYVMSPYPSAGAPVCAGRGNISFSNLTSLEGLQTFVYTPCTITFANNNTNGWDGQLIGGVVNITNHMTLNFVPVVVPGSDVAGYSGGLGYIREIT